MIFKGLIEANDFGGFIIRLLQKYPEIEQNFEKTVFYMDNASIHKEKNLKNKLFNKKNILYGPPYTPQFNPIEEFFGLLK